MTEFNIDEFNKKLVSLTIDANEKKKIINIERFKNARIEAIEYITRLKDDNNPDFINFDVKMTNAAKIGHTETSIYTFQWTDDKSADKDSDENKIKFGDNVRLLDIITKGGKEFFDSLDNFFNKNGSNTFHSRYKKYVDKVTNIVKYHICVSWSNPDIKKYESTTVFRGGKNKINKKNSNLSINRPKINKDTI
jgi:hypothetical protein